MFDYEDVKSGGETIAVESESTGDTWVPQEFNRVKELEAKVRGLEDRLENSVQAGMDRNLGEDCIVD